MVASCMPKGCASSWSGSLRGLTPGSLQLIDAKLSSKLLSAVEVEWEQPCAYVMTIDAQPKLLGETSLQLHQDLQTLLEEFANVFRKPTRLPPPS
ncbi:hypothetical protein GOBAR_DD18319 [Gossypium barbadense]|nr:hypothetical protein GOBAR_DD18319 [Gossypium barbadense]